MVETTPNQDISSDINYWISRIRWFFLGIGFILPIVFLATFIRLDYLRVSPNPFIVIIILGLSIIASLLVLKPKGKIFSYILAWLSLGGVAGMLLAVIDFSYACYRGDFDFRNWLRIALVTVLLYYALILFHAGWTLFKKKVFLGRSFAANIFIFLLPMLLVGGGVILFLACDFPRAMF